MPRCDVGCGYISPHDVNMIIKFCSCRYRECMKYQELAERFDDLRHEQAESAALVESMVEGVIAADRRGHIVTANSAARRLLGYEPIVSFEEGLRHTVEWARTQGA